MACRSALLLLLVAGCLGASRAAAQDFQIRSAGAATITGAQGGSVLVGGGTTNIMVTVNFGEVSPINPNAVVRVSIPLLLRSESPYQLTATVTGSTLGADPSALRLSDVGVGLVNVRRLDNGRQCPGGHQVRPPFDNDPALTVNRTVRATYPATLALATNPVVVLSGPRLSTRNLNPGGGAPFNTDGWAVDVVLALVPQFFVPGTSSVTVIFQLSSGPPNACP